MLQVGLVECCNTLPLDELERIILENINVDIWILPELFCNTYMGCFEPLFTAELAKEQTNTVLPQIKGLCIKHKVAICFGYAEVVKESCGNTKIYNTAGLFDENGDEIAKHRKTMLWGRENDVFAESNVVASIVTYRGICIALGICYEVEFPEIIRKLALKGAELILIPTSCVAKFVAE